MSGLIDIAATIGLVGLIWIAGVILIKAAESAEFRHAHARQAGRTSRRRARRSL